MRSVVLLRGINLGSTRKIPMGELRSLLEQSGFERVETYIRSGNVALDHPPDTDVASVCRAVIQERFGFEVPAVVLSADELTDVVDANPYADLARTDPTKVHVVFLSESPDEVGPVEGDEGEDASPGYRCVYLRLPNGLGRSKFAEAVGKQLPPEATMRNWRTVLKLVEMAN